MISYVEHIFICVMVMCVSSLEKHLFRSPNFFFIQFVFFNIELCECLHILTINLLSVISFANIFSHSVGCLFALLMVCYAVQASLINLNV